MSGPLRGVASIVAIGGQHSSLVFYDAVLGRERLETAAMMGQFVPDGVCVAHVQMMTKSAEVVVDMIRALCRLPVSRNSLVDGVLLFVPVQSPFEVALRSPADGFFVQVLICSKGGLLPALLLRCGNYG